MDTRRSILMGRRCDGRTQDKSRDHREQAGPPSEARSARGLERKRPIPWRHEGPARAQLGIWAVDAVRQSL
eukprot:8694914-Heterocapsa_arctica.AAC.1